MQFQVPQYIEVEAKIVGFLTLKQFIYLAGAAAGVGAVYILTKSFFLTLIIPAPLVVLALLLAFYKVNNKPFVYIMEAAFKYLFSKKLYIWKKVAKPVEASLTKKAEDPIQENVAFMPKLSSASKLRNLTWNLDVSKGQDSSNK